MEYSDYLDKLKTKSNEKWFNWYVRIPWITLIIIAIFFFVWGIIDITNYQEVVFRKYGTKVVKETLYGYFRLSTRIGAALIWWGIGAVASIGSYFLLKAIFSPKILSVLYLRKIKTDLDKIVFSKDIKENTKVISNPEWVCAKCGTKNNDSAKNCTNCFEPKP